MRLSRLLCGQRTYSIIRTVTAEEIQNYAQITGDTNPIHFQGESSIVHGTFLLGLVSNVMGTKCPGPGTQVMYLDARFRKPVIVGSPIEITVKILEEKRFRKVVNAEYVISDPTFADVTYVTGHAKLMQEKSKIDIDENCSY